MKSLVIGIAVLSMLTGVMAVYHPLAPAFGWVAALCIILFAAPTLYAWVMSGDRAERLVSLACLSLFAYIIEMMGVNAGFPYGSFRYGSGLGPLIVGVPWVLPFAWTPLVIGAWTLTRRVALTPVRLVLTALVLICIDLVLDPAAVALAYWKYDFGGWFYQIPWTNFAGWLLSGFIGAFILSRFARLKTYTSYSIWLISGFLWTLCFWLGANLAQGHLIPILIGFMMLASLMIWWYKLPSKRHPYGE